MKTLALTILDPIVLALIFFLPEMGRAADEAGAPYPLNGDPNRVSPNIVLSWTAGDHASAVNGHDVYFGTDYNAVLNHDVSVHVALQSGTTYTPRALLTAGTTYFWRVDEVSYTVAPFRWPGAVWAFKVFDGSSLLPEFRNGYGLWTVDSMTKVPISSRPGSYPANPSAIVKLAKGEYEGFQVALVSAPGRRLDRVRLETSDLIKAGDTIRACNVSWMLVGLISYGGDNYPDILLPVRDFNMFDGNAHAVLVTVYAPPGTATGDYVGTITVKTDSGLDSLIDVTATVHDFGLPIGPGFNTNSFTLNDWPQSTWAPGWYQAYGDSMLQFRLNPDNIYRNGTPAIANLEHWYDLGLNCFNVHKADSLNYPPEVSVVSNWLDQLALAPHGKQLRAMSTFYGFDEKSREYCEINMVPVFTQLKNMFPDIPRNNTSHMYAPSPRPWLDPIGDMMHFNMSWVTAEVSLYNFNDGETLRKSGYQYWGYNAYLTLGQPYIYHRDLFWCQYQTKADGFLYYSVNGWPGSGTPPTIDPASGPFISYTPLTDGANGEILFPGTTGPLASMRMANLRDGIEDYNYLCILAQKIGSVEVPREISEQVASGWSSDRSIPVTMNARDAVAAWITQPFLAKSPSPGHRSKGISDRPTLTWVADSPSQVDSFNVYFGKDYGAVLNATPASPEYKGNQTGTAYSPGTLARNDVTYYWRIDEVVGPQVWKGYVWKFEPAFGLCGWWKFDEASGETAMDSSGRGNHGVIVNAAHVPGRLSNALQFVGDGYVAIPPAALSTLDTQVSVSFWQYGKPCQAGHEWIFEAKAMMGEVILRANVPAGDGKVYWYAGNDSTDGISKQAALYEVRNRWNHWVFTKNAGTGTMRIYLNGTLWLEGTGKTVPLATVATLKIGAAADGTSGYEGILDDFRMYDRELTQSDVSALFSDYYRPAGRGLMGWWRFDELSGNSATDSSDYQNHGTLHNAGQPRLAGKVGNCLNFNGIDDHVTIPVNGLSFPGKDFTLALWTHGDASLPNAGYGSVAIAARRADGSTGWMVSIPFNDGKIFFRAGSDIGADTHFSPVAQPSEYKGQWNHWVFTRESGDRGLARMYLNGSLYYADPNYVIANLGTIASFKIGSDASGTNPYKGKLDEVRLFNYELAAAEVASLYNADVTAFLGDTTAPVISCPSDRIVNCADAAGTRVTFTVIATDNNDACVTVTCAPPSDSQFPPGTHVVTCSATDTAGNRGSCSFSVGVLPSLLSIERAIILRWNCGEVLQGADSMNGPWTDIPGVGSPYAVPASAARKFYRARN